jgi:hypothetical protein
MSKKYILGNPDIDTSFITLEMSWRGMRDPRVEQQVDMVHPDNFEEIIKGSTINTYIDANTAKLFIDKCAESVLSDKLLLEKLKAGTVAVTQQIRDYAVESLDRLDNLHEEEMIEVLSNARHLQSESLVYGIVVAWADVYGAITDKIVDIVRSRKKLSQPIYLYTNILGGPFEQSLTDQAYEAIRTSSASSLIKKYFWLDQGYIGRGLSKRQIQLIQKEHEFDKLKCHET